MIKKDTVTVLDIGNTKVCCCIAEVFTDGSYNIIGVGYCACIGMKSGAIVDMVSVEKSIAVAVEQAENMAGIRVSSVYVSVSGKNLKSNIITISAKIGGRVIDEKDMMHLYNQIEVEDENIEILQALPIWYQIDSVGGIKDPVGMFANQLSVCFNIISSPLCHMRNLHLCLAHCHLELQAPFPTTYASGLGVLDDNELEEHQTVIDFGGELTTVSFFANQCFCGSEIIPIGGRHITNDIVFGLNTSETNAERVKTLYGSAIPSLTDAREMIYIPVKEEGESVQLQSISKDVLNQLIQPRVEEILKKLKKKMDESRFPSDFSRNIVITGGGSLLTGMRELTASCFKKNIVLKKVKKMIPGSDIPINHDFSVAIGMIKLSQKNIYAQKLEEKPNKKHSLIKKTLNWFKNNL